MANEIKCPNCGEAIQLDESDYAAVARQVRDNEFEKELSRRAEELRKQSDAELQLKLLQQAQDGEQAAKEASRQLFERDGEIAALRAKLDAAETEKKLAVAEAISAAEKRVSEKEATIVALQGDLVNAEAAGQLREKALAEKHAAEVKGLEETIGYYRDMKARMSTKAIGESLEQYCMDQFNAIRMTAFPNGVYFEKDNEVSKSGSKGDFIFRESQDGVETLSIMFEMKNEADAGASAKHRNEDFFRELDKDRREKGCEYAVLVSMLEPDSDFYNAGIVDVSYRYPKMYVVRPQCFLTIIGLLRNAALNALQYQKELQVVRNQQLDLVHFEENMEAFKAAFGRNYRLASEHFQTAIENIDKTIDLLEKVKKSLLSSENNLRLANNKAEDLSIKKLTKGAPTVMAMFEALHNEAPNPQTGEE